MSSENDKMTSGVVLPAVKSSLEVCLLVGMKPMAACGGKGLAFQFMEE